MSEISIKEFAEKLTLSTEKLLSQIEKSGIKDKTSESSLSEEERVTLLNYLKSLHGESSSSTKRVTLNRKKVQKLSFPSNGGKRTVNIEVRKKRTYVKKPEIIEQSEEIVKIPEVEEKAEIITKKVVVAEKNIKSTNKESVTKVVPEEVVLEEGTKKEKAKKQFTKQDSAPKTAAKFDKNKVVKGKSFSKEKQSKKNIAMSGGNDAFGRRRHKLHHHKRSAEIELEK